MKISCIISLMIIIASCTPQSEHKPTSEVVSYPFVVEDDLIDFTPELREKALLAVADFRLSPSLYSPPSLKDAADGTKQNTERRTPQTPFIEQSSANTITKRQTPNSVQRTLNAVHDQSPKK